MAGKARIVITGSTRGFGYALARELLRRGCSVLISGSSEATVTAALASLRQEAPGARLNGFACDVTASRDADALWGEAVRLFGGADHWINNAGVAQPLLPVWELPPESIERVVDTDLLGALYGARAAVRGMARQGSGTVWFVEGHGSDNRVMKGLSVYGSTKRAVRYLARALAIETEGTGVQVGAISPGIMITDFTMKQIDRSDRAAWERTKRIFNILADRPESVAAFVAPRILAARRSGVLISWLTNRKIFFRFLAAPFRRRAVVPE